MDVTLLAIVDLVVLIAAAAFGAASLLAWARHRTDAFPVKKIVAHVALQLMSIGIWMAFVITGRAAVAWAAFVVITVGQVFGDLLMFASHRARHPGAHSSYLGIGGEVLSFRRPLPAFHALVGAVGWFGMLAICIIATVAR
ncbi:hypothetical protein ACFPZL_00260 [Leucobacter soli]|uniref:Uncharacterized protein n=1 Tax=Leucobacter soli TaxID=2812850 RepID=A0A916JWA2_9MICO|nr:hypothetical protein [Leucobacter soli]CAG7602432.1 hypothetical protein LEUCIP111803_00556 [Leucobacter soli]